jgi:hypothetical protein
MSFGHAKLTITSIDEADETPSQLAKNLQGLLAESGELKIAPVAREHVDMNDIESRAEPITLSALAISFITSGAITALIGALKAMYLGTRATDIEYSIELSDGGGKLSLKTSNLSKAEATRVLEQWALMTKALESGPHK